MPWFGVKLLLKAMDENGECRLAEESVRLIQGKDFEEVEQKAFELCQPEQDPSFRVVGKFHPPVPCVWILDSVLDIFSIDDEPAEGVEVYSLILQPDEAVMLEQMYEANECDCDSGSA